MPRILTQTAVTERISCQVFAGPESARADFATRHSTLAFALLYLFIGMILHGL
jgi:hypothetical protein